MTAWYQTLTTNLEQGKLFALATVVAGPSGVGDKLLIDADGTSEGAFPSSDLQAQVIQTALALMREELSETRTYGEYQVFVQTFAPFPRLVIIGAVHTAIPLARYARILGYKVIVVDGRARFATHERFPDVDELRVEWPDEAIPALGIDRSTYVVILTHDPKFDLPALKALEGTPARYIGAMGSRETRKKHMEQLQADGVSADFLKSVYGPVGLDLGGRSPEEMALAIMAEITAVRYGHRGGHLKKTSEP